MATVKRALSAVAAAAILTIGSAAQAGVLVSESFDTDGAISAYTGTGKVFSAYSGNASSATVSGGNLRMQMLPTDGNAPNPYLHIGLGGTQPLLSMKMEFTGVNYSAANDAFKLMIGSYPAISNFNPGSSIYGDRSWAKVNVRAESLPYTIAAVGGGATSANGTSVTRPLNTKSTWTLFLNASGNSETFAGPDSASHTLAPNTWTMFMDNTLLVDNYPRGDGDAPNTANYSVQGIVLMGFRNYSGGTSISDIGSIVVRNDLAMVPEPVSLGVLGLAGIALMSRRRK